MFSKESVRVQTEQSTQVVSYVGKVTKCHCERQRWPLSTGSKEGVSGFISSSLLVTTSLLNLVEANLTPSGEMPKGQAGERPAPTSRLDKVYAEKNRYFATVTNRDNTPLSAPESHISRCFHCQLPAPELRATIKSESRREIAAPAPKLLHHQVRLDRVWGCQQDAHESGDKSTDIVQGNGAHSVQCPD